MAAPDNATGAGNVVEGFSERFAVLLDRARVPRAERISICAKRFGVVYNTFKSWCQADRIPGSHGQLVDLVEALLKDIPGRHNSRSVVAWLLAGDAVPHPFADDTDALAFVELYLQISDVAHRAGYQFDKLPREARNRMLKHVLKHLRDKSTKADNGVQLDEAAVSMVLGMLDTASAVRGAPLRGR